MALHYPIAETWVNWIVMLIQLFNFQLNKQVLI